MAFHNCSLEASFASNQSIAVCDVGHTFAFEALVLFMYEIPSTVLLFSSL
jgi:hypothetical protein